jgi:membrane-associated phospholipid phosphatase
MTVFRGPHWEHGFAFPSGHAFASFALAAVFCAWYPRWRWLFIVGAIAVALARVQLDRHFFGDVLFGAFLGWYMAWALVSWRRARTSRAGRGPAQGEPVADEAAVSETM